MTKFERRLALILERLGTTTAPMPTRPGTLPDTDEPELEPEWGPEPEPEPEPQTDPFEPDWPEQLPFSEPKARHRRPRL